MSGTGPHITIEKELQPYIKELDFAADSYAYGLRLLGVPEPAVGSLKIGLNYSEHPFRQKGWYEIASDRKLLGFYDAGEHAIGLFPRTIAASSYITNPKSLPRDYARQSSNLLSAVHNFVLLHETGHLIDDLGDDKVKILQGALKHNVLVANLQSMISRSALLGAVAGAETADILNRRPILGSIVGTLALGGVGFIVAEYKYGEGISQHGKNVEVKEQAAVGFAQNLTALALLGNIIQIELKT